MFEGDITQAKSGGSYHSYEQAFRAIIRDAEGMHEDDMIMHFRRGLSPVLQKQCAVQPVSGIDWDCLDSLMDFARGEAIRLESDRGPSKQSALNAITANHGGHGGRGGRGGGRGRGRGRDSDKPSSAPSVSRQQPYARPPAGGRGATRGTAPGRGRGRRDADLYQIADWWRAPWKEAIGVPMTRETQ